MSVFLGVGSKCTIPGIISKYPGKLVYVVDMKTEKLKVRISNILEMEY